MDKTATGLVMLTVAMILYGVINPILKKAGFNPFATIIVQIAFLWISIIPFFIFTKSHLNVISNRANIPLLVIAGVVNAIGYYLVVKSYTYLPIWQINIFWVLAPLSGAVAAYFILGEPLAAKFFVGLTFTLVGLYIAFR